MQRIMIIGCAGAGKSTLARALHQRLDLNLIHLDKAYWRPGWVESPTGEWEENMHEFAKGDNWIIDGNYSGTMEIRLARADTIIFLDRSRWTCLWRSIRRILHYYGSTRPDMTEGCPERFDWRFLLYVFFFNHTRRPALLKRLNRIRPDQQFLHLRSNREVAIFLAGI